MSQSRQLAAIMFTDIVGYTALMGNDEQKAFAILSKNRDLQKPFIEQFNGKWIKELGDGVMASFNTVSDAVNAAIKIQEACNAAKDFKLRIGIHLGEVVFENDDVFGDGVNIAARIQSIAAPGGIYISESVYNNVSNKESIKTEFVKVEQLKNVKEPTRIYRVITGFDDAVIAKMPVVKIKRKKGILITSALVVMGLVAVFIFKDSIFQKNSKAGVIKSLAILPFENLFNDSTLAYLTDGMPENLINRFSALEGIKVFARSATFGLADSNRTVQNLRKILNADMVLTGQLQKKGEGYFLNCELVDTENQNLIWGNKYELGTTDISRIEDSIITSLLNPLKISLISKSKIDQQNKPVNPLAYAEYLKGRYMSYGSTAEESEKALSHFREAINIDPKYAKAYAAIANEKVNQALFSTASKNEIVNEARTALEAAKAMDPEIADIYSTEGALKFYYDWDWQGAVESYKKALELDPGNASIYIRYSATLADVGRYKEALPLAEKAVELDPVSISSLHNLGWVYYLAGNFRKSTEAFGKALELHPNWIWGHVKKTYGHIFLKEYDKALPLARRAESLFKDGWGSELLQATLASIYKSCNEKEKSDSIISRFIKYATENTVKDPFNLSFIYYLKGDYEKAIEWEEKTIEKKSLSAYLMNIPLLYSKEYFQSAAHQNILKKMGFVK
ncbi:MAG: tetratricopeptide repeat protein [Chitinophagaceae bacterium]|nr:tetratricopeptide repeat protein [Chitinophagaceae bacterium]MBK8607782.1 tetratricopeptide repeat protein [Chitinophagaceae bacterium]MBP6477408.1 tetratricopeptide repeat protein [Chitinophagaceae bacterium]MBP7107062.1 tetratricopeptide repeat protein [Chitinophagaceae bacterium]MBP7315227.1 tetratricopeptide repeat protein [Chitinophagaceae bacterium]